MADNIFDAQRDRRIQNLQQQSVSNIVRTNPNLRGVLTRYEDAEVSRLKLLELQRNRTKKITAGERALLKTLRKGRRATGGGRVGRAGKKVKVQRRIPVPDADGVIRNQTRVVEVEEFVGKDQQIGEGGSKDPIDPELERDKLRLAEQKQAQESRQQERFLELEDYKQQREFIANERGLQQRELQRQGDFISGQNRLVADAQIAQFNQAQETFRANQRGIDRIADRQLQQDRVDLQRRQIDTEFETNREQRALEYRRIDGDVERYNAEVQRAAIERDQQAIRADAEIQGIRERVAGDNARQHAELQATQQLALERLAAQQRDNELTHQREQNRIDNQRAVDAERAITDREREQTLQSGLDAVNRLQVPAELPVIPENIIRQGRPGETPARPPAEFRADVSGLDEGLREVDEDGNITGVGELNLSAERDSLSSSTSSEGSLLAGSPPDVQRAVNLQGNRRASTPSPRGARVGATPRRFERGSLEQDPQTPREGEQGAGLLRPSPQRTDRLGSFASEEVSGRALSGQRRQRTSPRSGTPPRRSPRELAAGSTSSGEQEEEFLPGQVVGAVGGAVATGVGAAGRLAGGAVGGVAQGIYEQLPGAGDVGAAVGRGGARLVGGIASAAYQGLAGGAAEPEPDQPIDRASAIYDTLRRQGNP